MHDVSIIIKTYRPSLIVYHNITFHRLFHHILEFE